MLTAGGPDGCLGARAGWAASSPPDAGCSEFVGVSDTFELLAAAEACNEEVSALALPSWLDSPSPHPESADVCVRCLEEGAEAPLIGFVLAPVLDLSADVDGPVLDD